MEGGYGSSIVWVGFGKAGVLSDEVGHGENARHPTSVISEKDAAEGSKSTDEVGFYCDGSFNPIDIGRAMDDNTSSHLGVVCSEIVLGQDLTTEAPRFVKVKSKRGGGPRRKQKEVTW